MSDSHEHPTVPIHVEPVDGTLVQLLNIIDRYRMDVSIAAAHVAQAAGKVEEEQRENALFRTRIAELETRVAELERQLADAQKEPTP